MTLEMFIVLFGGLGLFIYGMHVMSEGLKTIAGDQMKRLLEILTNNKIKAILVGTIVTVIVQSSSTTTVMVVGFVNAGLMSLFQAAGVILGANIGTTITAQLVAFKATTFAPIFIGVGTFIVLFARKKRTRNVGSVLLGFGVLFLGISLMSEAMEPLRESQEFIDLLVQFGDNPIYGLLIGAGITAIVQSSSASIGLLQAIAISGAFASVGGVESLEICVPILLGTNIGTCVTALLSSIGTNTNAKKAALIHLFVNVFGALWVLALMFIMNNFTDVNPVYEWLVSTAGTTVSDTGETMPNVARQIANAHTLFNIVNMIVLFPLMDYFVKLLNRLMPEKEEEKEEKALQLDTRLLENPSVALGQVTNEVRRMGQIARKNFSDSKNAFVGLDDIAIERVYRREKIINSFEKDMLDYLIHMSNIPMSDKENDTVATYIKLIHDIERIGDHTENIIELIEMVIDDKLIFSEKAKNDLEELFQRTEYAIKVSIGLIGQEDIKEYKTVLEIEDWIDEKTESLRYEHMVRLSSGECNTSAGVIYVDILSNIERIGDHAANIARKIYDIT
jgi:phosphate:Na+ symporter